FAAPQDGSTNNFAMNLDNQGSLIMVGSTNSNNFEWVAPNPDPLPIQEFLYGGAGNDGAIVKLSCVNYQPCPTCRTANTDNSDLDNSSLKLEELNLKIYPNPFTNETNLVISGEGSYNVKIINTLGEVSFEKENVSANEIYTLGNDLPQGLYVIQVSGNGKTYTGRIIKQ
ncbi:MAG: T9SS type A sorting domain-containing protein, partial [Cytophagaceae bacterium]|nr:T9SS type A sorting domain-containing protein [Cytophagaceae bacterium]